MIEMIVEYATWK